MGLNLSPEDITALETRTEGWIAGLQLAALSLQGQEDATSFITSFTGSHHFVMDYLVEEVLQQQPEASRRSCCARPSSIACAAPCVMTSCSIRRFPGRQPWNILNTPICSSFPLDNERRWYRYHHLFRDLLRQRLSQGAASSGEEAESSMNELHRRASAWYEDHGFPLEAFRHAAAAMM